MTHEALRKTWSPDQRWETRIVSTKDGPVPAPVWTPVADGKEPMWDPYQEYRQVPVAPPRTTRDVAGILHFLTPQQMAEEIVRLEAVIAGQAPNILMGRVPPGLGGSDGR